MVDTKIKLTLRVRSYAVVTDEHSVICCHFQTKSPVETCRSYSA